MRVAGFCQDPSACTAIRIAHPLRRIKALGLADVDLIESGDQSAPEKCFGANVVMLGRAAGDNVLRIMRKVQEGGGKVVYDLDDNYFEVSPCAQEYKSFGIMPINMDAPDGRSIALHRDGEGGFDIRRNRKFRKNFIDALRLADVVTVTTEPLQREYMRFNDNVRLVPNAVDFSVWEKPPIRWNHDEVRLLYTGAANHQEDFFFIKDVLQGLQEKYRNLRIVFIGTDWKIINNGLDYSRVEYHPWVHVEAYPHLLKSLCCDIGIAPISKTKFNDARSALKWKEYSALKIATVATGYGPYKRRINDGVTGLLVDTKEEWFAALSRLIEDEPFRSRLAMNAYNVCKFKHNLDFVVDDWMRVFKGVMA